MDRSTFLDLIPAYALGALDEDERADFEAQLAEDSEAQALLAEYQRVADSLVLTVAPRMAPARLHDDLRWRVAQRHDANHPQLSTPKRAAPLLLIRGLAAVAILAIIFALTFALNQRPPKPTEWSETGRELYQRLQNTANVVSIDISPAENFEGISGHLLIDPTDNQAVIRVSNLPTPAEDQTYQLWLVNQDGQATSGGLYKEVVDGTMYIVLPASQPLDSYRAFGCSLEPAGGSPYSNKRSGPSVFRVQLADA